MRPALLEKGVGFTEHPLFLHRATLPEYRQVVEHGAVITMEDLTDPAGTQAPLRQQTHRHPAGLHEQGIVPTKEQGGGRDIVGTGSAGNGVAGPGGRGR